MALSPTPTPKSGISGPGHLQEDRQTPGSGLRLSGGLSTPQPGVWQSFGSHIASLSPRVSPSPGRHRPGGREPHSPRPACLPAPDRASGLPGRAPGKGPRHRLSLAPKHHPPSSSAPRAPHTAAPTSSGARDSPGIPVLRITASAPESRQQSPQSLHRCLSRGGDGRRAQEAIRARTPFLGPGGSSESFQEPECGQAVA